MLDHACQRIVGLVHRVPPQLDSGSLIWQTVGPGMQIWYARMAKDVASGQHVMSGLLDHPC